MYTEPKIVNAEGPGRPYVTFSFNGVRQRVSSGRVIGLRLHPIKAKTPEERKLILVQLREALVKALANGKYTNPPTLSKDEDVRRILTEIHHLSKKLNVANQQFKQQSAKLKEIQTHLDDYLKR